jgi:hypothetical protein
MSTDSVSFGDSLAVCTDRDGRRAVVTRVAIPAGAVVSRMRGDPKIRAGRDLAPGAELTLDYCATEEELAEPFECRYGGPRCYGTVAGFRYLTTAQRVAILEILAPHPRRIHTDQAPPMGTWVAPEVAAGAA